MSNDIRQSALFADFMSRIGWEVRRVNSTYIYMRKFPVIGYFAKIPRSSTTFSLDSLKLIQDIYPIFQWRIAPFVKEGTLEAKNYRSLLFHHRFRIEQAPFNPTTTILIDLKQSPDVIFNRFTSVKRRAVRRAVKNGIIIKESDEIEAFIRLRQFQYRPLGFLITKETRMLFDTFYPKHASLLLAYSTIPLQSRTYFSARAKNYVQVPVAGILLLFYNHVAYYWFASSLPIGKKLFAPSLLVCEALKIAKIRGCTLFDFEGIYDERFPKAAASWRGFTKFKEGFGGRKVVYLENFRR